MIFLPCNDPPKIILCGINMEYATKLARREWKLTQQFCSPRRNLADRVQSMLRQLEKRIACQGLQVQVFPEGWLANRVLEPFHLHLLISP